MNEQIIRFIDEDIDGDGTDIVVFAEVVGDILTNGTAERIHASIDRYKAANRGEWDTDGCLDAAREQLESEGYKVRFFYPSVEICF